MTKRRCAAGGGGVQVLGWLGAHRRADSALGRALDALFAPLCLFCGESAGRTGLDLCAHCARALPWLDAPGPGTRVWSALHYSWPVDGSIRRLKFAGDLSAARVFGALLAAHRAAHAPVQAAALVPVPLHVSRRAERGFDQSRRLADEMSRWLGVPVVPDLLVRRRATASQSGLSALARRSNVIGAFEVFAPCVARDAPLALIDDVCTTGATLAAASRALRSAGYRHIECWTIARAGYVGSDDAQAG